MSNNVAEAVIGGVVLLVAGTFFAFAGKFGGLDGSSESYPLSASFRSAEGISVGTDVRLAGIHISNVTELSLIPEDFRAKASFTVRSDVQLPEDSDVKISSEGLLGGNFIEVTPGASEFMLEPGDDFVNTQGSVDLLNLLMRFGTGQ